MKKFIIPLGVISLIILFVWVTVLSDTVYYSTNSLLFPVCRTDSNTFTVFYSDAYQDVLDEKVTHLTELADTFQFTIIRKNLYKYYIRRNSGELIPLRIWQDKISLSYSDLSLACFGKDYSSSEHITFSSSQSAQNNFYKLDISREMGMPYDSLVDELNRRYHVDL